MDFEVLGPVHVPPGDVLGGRLQHTLLAVLLVHANRPVPTDVLTNVLWPDAPSHRADQNLRLHVHRLRRALRDADRLAFESGGYRLRVLPGELDADRFESLVDDAAKVVDREPERGVALIREAMGLWRGRAYDGLDVPVVADEAQRLGDRRLAAVEQLYEAELAYGRDAAVVGELTDLVRRHPLRERLAALLMAALSRAGRQSDALRVYQHARRVLVDELGLEPGPQLRAIEQQVLAGEPVDLGGERRAARTVPAQLPANVRGFVGREGQLAELDRLATEAGESTGIVTLLGTAGVGKTALAVRWAHRIRERFPDGQLYVDLHGYGPSAPVAADDALAGFLRALGVEGAAIPQAIEERAARFRSLVDGRRILVVLDNARTVDQVRPLLPGAESCFVLVTSRDALAGIGAREGARRVNVDRLSADESRHLMRQLLGDLAPDVDAGLDGLIERCVRLPLAMRIAVDLVNLRPTRGVTGLVAELADERDRLDLLEVEDDPHSAVRAVFSWSYRQLSPETAGLFRTCGLHPGPDVDAYALAALAGRDRRDTRRSLDRLIRAHLIDERAEDRYQMHDLLRAYARELAAEAEPVEARAEAIARLSAYYLATVSAAMDLIAPYESKERPAAPAVEVPRLSTHEEARAWLDGERANLLALVPEADDSYTTALSTMLFRYFELGGYYDDALSVYTLALESARRSGDVRAEIRARRNLGSTYYSLGRYDESVEHDEHAIELCRTIGDRQAEGHTYVNQGATERMRGRYLVALGLYQRAMELHSADDGPFAMVLASNTGSLYVEMGDPEKAVGYLEPALRLAEELESRAGQVTVRCILAEAQAALGADEVALELGREAIAIAREVASLALEADALNALGRVYELRGDHEKALAHYERGLETARHAGHAIPRVEALLGLGRTHRLLGNAARALRRFEEAADLVAAHGQRHQQAHTRVGIGDAYADLGEPHQAREHWHRALDLYRELGLPEAEEVQAKLDALED